MPSTDTKNVLPIKHLSASSIKKFSACPYAFKAKYILKLDMPKNEHLAYGGSVHEAVELQVRMKKKLKGKNLPLDAVLAKYQKAAVENAQYLNPQLRDKFRKMYPGGHDLVEKLYFKMLELNPTGTELPFKKDMGYMLPMSGRFDLLFEDGFGELKTVSKPFGKSEIDSMIQLTIYWEIYKILFGDYPERIRLIEANKKTGEVDVRYVTRNQTHRQKLDIMVNKMIQMMMDGEYPRCNQRNCWACAL